MKSWIKILLGFTAHGFLLSMGFFVVYLVPRIFELVRNKDQNLPPSFLVFIPLVLAGNFSVLVAMGIFIAYLVKNPRFSSTERVVWILLLALTSALAAPIFFWVVIFRHPNGQPFFGNVSKPSPA